MTFYCNQSAHDQSLQSVNQCDFYSISPVSILSLASHPDFSDSLLSQSDPSNSAELVDFNSDFDRPIYSSDFKPKWIKTFRFLIALLTNICGGFTTKLDELHQLLLSNNVDIAVITETWLHDDIKSDTLELPDYTLYRLDRRDGRQGGGVAVYVKHGTPCSYLSHLTHTNLEVLWLLYRPHSMARGVTHLLIGTVYHPPKASNSEITDYLVRSMDEVTRTHPHTGILLLGDFNQMPDAQLRSFPLHQIVTNPTSLW